MEKFEVMSSKIGGEGPFRQKYFHVPLYGRISNAAARLWGQSRGPIQPIRPIRPIQPIANHCLEATP